MGYLDEGKPRTLRGLYERDQFTDEETEFIRAMGDYIRDNRRRFPHFHEVLAVLKSLGYQRVGENTFSQFMAMCKVKDNIGKERAEFMRGKGCRTTTCRQR